MDAKEGKFLEAVWMIKSTIENRKVAERDLQVQTQQVYDLRTRLT